MSMMDQAKMDGALTYLEQITREYRQAHGLALLLREEQRRCAVNAVLDMGLSLATVTRAAHVTRNTLNDWVATAELAMNPTTEEK